MTRADVPLVNSVRGAAKILGVSPSTITRFINANELRAARIGERIVIEGADLVQFFNSRKLRPPLRVSHLASAGTR